MQFVLPPVFVYYDMAFWLAFVSALFVSPCIAAAIAYKRGDAPFGWFVAGFLLGPLSVLLAYVMSGKWCVRCMTKAHHQSKQCPHCGNVLEPLNQPTPRTAEGS